MQFRPANPADFDDILRITAAARAYLAAQGSDQWAGGNPTPERIREDIARGFDQLAVDEKTGAVLGVVAAVDEPEADYDNLTSGAWLTEARNDPAQGPSTYMVLHRMAVAPEARRRGVATFLLAECLKLARARGFASVRVDTHHKNTPMQGGFEKAGFTRCCELLITSPLEPTKERIGYAVVL